jgi:hypothetical protein
MAVTIPEILPANTAASSDSQGLIPIFIRILEVVALKTKLPSQVRSGKSMTQNVRYIPRATMP